VPIVPTPESILASSQASNWLQQALREALQRDIVDAAHDAEFLAAVLRAQCNNILHLGDANADA